MFTTDLDELRTWTNERLLATRDDALRTERRAQMTRVSIDHVLNERGATNGRDAAEWVQSRDKVTTQTARGEVEVARALESLPAIKEAAEAGDLSMDQLEAVVELATPETDAEWAHRARHTQPSELNRLVRKQRVVSPGEMEERERAKQFRWWRSTDGTALNVRGRLYDVDAAFLEAVFEHEIDSMKPTRGQPWETRGKRGARALVQIVHDARGADARAARRSSWKPMVVVHVGSDAQPTVNGMPIAVETVQSLLDDGAKTREVRDNDSLAPKSGDAIPAALRIYLKGRDATCRVPGCDRAFGLDAHHLVPRCRGGRTDKHNVVLVCTTHHRRLVPHGPWTLSGAPERLDGLTMRCVGDSSDIDARAGPAA